MSSSSGRGDTNMDSKETDDEERPRMSREMLQQLQQMIEDDISKLQASAESISTFQDLRNLSNEIEYFQNLSNEIQEILDMTTENVQDPSQELIQIHEEIDEVFLAEEVGHSCDLCQRDLATDPERPNASLYSLQETSVLSCGHVYHSKCLSGTTLDFDNKSTDPSCIFCISSDN